MILRQHSAGAIVSKLKAANKLLVGSTVGSIVGILFSLWCLLANSISENSANTFYLKMALFFMGTCYFSYTGIFKDTKTKKGRATFFGKLQRQGGKFMVSLVLIMLVWMGSRAGLIPVVVAGLGYISALVLSFWGAYTAIKKSQQKAS